ncbi:hypothetical protein [Sphingomonas radiodurans]|uniref:hypothetical protein n=1 Tax=Sphingomonas radiodurans TaxID=2890321 RepID=UPI001E3C6109|nr:hypothetical protein [Sphingomonas radiodurans]WBH16073.1 hypothetical protein LLW23_14865 [Sphingomonas radiodurans]
MWNDIKRLYADSWAFAVALPILFSIPVLIEFAQHVVEIDIGMYRHGVSGVAMDQRRLTFGCAKTLAMILPGYWFVRYMAWDRNAERAKRIERPAATLFGIQFALHAVTQWIGLFGPPIGVLLGLDARLAQYVGLAFAIGVGVIGMYLTAWFVAWPLGNARIGPLRSFAVMAGSFWRAVGYTLAGSVPLMLLHYALGYGAIGRPDWLVWLMMLLDALVVGFLALTAAGGGYLAASRAAERNGIPLEGAAASR